MNNEAYWRKMALPTVANELILVGRDDPLAVATISRDPKSRPPHHHNKTTITMVCVGFLSMPWWTRVALVLFMVCNVCLELLSGAELSKQLRRSDTRETAATQAQEWTESSAWLDPTARPLCSRQQVQDGAWNKVIVEQAPYIPPNNHKLLCDRHQIKRFERGGYDSWSWMPNDDSCQLTEWNRNHFCTLMRQQTILFMGDSLTQEASFAFGELMGLRVSDGKGEPGNFPRYNLEGACNGTVEAVFRRADFLKPYNVEQELQEHFPHVVVLNRGAHYVEDEDLLQDMNETIGRIKAWQSRCTETNKRCLLIWRTTVPGHPGCKHKNATQPTRDRQAMERLIEADPRSIEWKWPLFQHQNELVENALAMSGIDYEMLDAYHINILRPDGHRLNFNDCLHNCLTSKLDVYSQILLHILQRRDWGVGLYQSLSS